MKMVKSLLLGTAAGLIAVAGAQAADLPVKAKPVEYVKVCSLYGAGFYYMPGTDICIKIGGFVRAQYYSWGGSNGSLNQWTSGYVNNRSATGNQDHAFRARWIATFDTRQQTEYGTLRTYSALGFSHDSNGASEGTYAKRAFIQLAGFTFGKAQSFFDHFSPASVSYFAWPSHDTGDGGKLLAAYTAQFGNGFSGSISLEEARRTSVVNATTAVFAAGTLPTSSYGNQNMPDIVGNLRVDQAWGSAQVMAALHQVRASYYTPANEQTGYPDDDFGWAIGGGLRLKADAISRGDVFQVSATYTEGALRYLADLQGGSSYALYTGNQVGLGWFSDGVFTGTNAANGSQIELTKGWAVTASYDHLWNNRWKTSLYGGLLSVEYGDAANAAICANVALTPATCESDWSTWWIGSRTQFNINASTYLGVDVLYTKLNSMEADAVGLPAASGHPAGLYTPVDQDNLGVTFRIHRDFLP